MSFPANRAVWDAADIDAEGLERASCLLVALAIADRVRKDSGEARCGTRALARRTRLSRPTVTAALRALECAGVIEAVERGVGAKATRWRVALLTTNAHPGDNGARVSNGDTLADSLRANPLHPGEKPRHASGQNGDTITRPGYIPLRGARVDKAPEHLPEALEPGEMSARVGALRESLTRGARGHHRAPLTDDGAPFTHEGAP
jgi:DNA-binding transcriptional ArsR family regulator